MSRITISMSRNLLSSLDMQRGDIPRSRFVARILADAFGIKKMGVGKND